MSIFSGEIKLADFGLARLYQEELERPYTNRVSLWLDVFVLTMTSISGDYFVVSSARTTARRRTIWYSDRCMECRVRKSFEFSATLILIDYRCILGELFVKKPLFQGNSEMTQLEIISKLCGTPSPEVWPDVVNLPLFASYRPRRYYRRVLKETFQL